MYNIGIDIGSSSAKAAVLRDGKVLCHTLVRPTGWDSVDTSKQIAANLAELGIDVAAQKVVATGYGRNSVPYAQKTLTEISCHGQGAAWLFGQEPATVIDIGGQDSKIILIEDGKVCDFIMNDKCSAGTGRFMEIMAGVLGMGIDELCEQAHRGGGLHISSMCTVFAESEVIGLIGNGAGVSDIAYAIIDSITTKIKAQASKLLPDQGSVYLTGGLCEQPHFLAALGEKLGRQIFSDPRARYAGAIGAALFSAQGK